MAGSRSQHELTVEIAGKIASSFGSAIGNVNKHMATLGKMAGRAAKLTVTGMAAAGTAIAGVVAASTNVGKDFEAQMSTVGAIAGTVANEDLPAIVNAANEMGLSFKEGADATETSMNILEAKAKQMGATTQFSASEAGQAMEYMAMAGWKGADMIQGIEGIMNLAAASGEDLASTSDIVTDALTAFGLTASDSGKFADVLAAASSNANTNVSMLGESFKYVAPLAGALGYSAEDASMALGLMANAGIKGSQAGTSLKTALANMSAPTDKQAAAMKKLGLSLTDGEGNMKSMREVMLDMRSSFAGLSEAEQTAAASTIFGKDAMSGMLAIINASEDDFNKLTNAIDNSSGAAAKMAAIRLDNLEGDITLLKSGLEGLGIEIYQGINAPMREAAQLATEYVARMNAAFQEGGFSGMVEEIGSIVSDALLKIAEYAPDFIKMAATLIKSLIQGIENNSGKLADSAAQVLTVFINGIFEMIPQIILAGIDLILRFTQSITAQLPQLMSSGIEAVSNFVSGLAARLPEITSTAVQLINSLTQGIQANLPNLIPTAMNALVSFSGSLRSNVGLLVDAGLQLIMALAQSFIDNIPVLIETIPTIVTNIAGIINDNAPKLLSVGIQLIIQLALGILQAIPTIVANIPQIIQAIVSVFTAFNWLALGSQIITFIGNGIKTAITSLPQIFNNFVQTAHNIVSSFGWQSLGRGIIQLLADGISSMITAIPQIFGNIGNFAVQAITSIDWWGVGTTIIQLIGEAISGAGGFILDAIKGIGGGIIDGIKGLFSGTDVDVSSSGAAATQSYAAGIAGNASAISGAASTLTTTAFSNMDLSGAMNAGTEAGTAFSTGLTDSLSSGGFDSSAFSANMTTIGTDGATSLTEGLNAGLTAATIDTASLTVDTSSFTTSMTTAGTEGAAAIGSGMESNSQAVTAAATSLETGINTALDSGWQKAESSTQTAMQSLTQTVTTAAQASAQAVKSAFESMTITIPQPKIPRISVSTSSVSYGDGGSVSIPNFSISYYAQGGIMDSPTLFGMVGGEAGPEGIIPLDPFWNRLDSAVSAAVENFGGVSQARQDVVALSGMQSAAGGIDSRAKELYGEIAGNHTENISNDNSTSENSPKLVFSPQITIQGNASKEDVQSALSWSQEEFNRMMQEYNWQNGRTAMA